jgi:hypothetical protein
LDSRNDFGFVNWHHSIALLLLYFGKPVPVVEPAIRFAPEGVAILSNHDAYKLRVAFLFTKSKAPQGT